LGRAQERYHGTNEAEVTLGQRLPGGGWGGEKKKKQNKGGWGGGKNPSPPKKKKKKKKTKKSRGASELMPLKKMSILISERGYLTHREGRLFFSEKSPDPTKEKGGKHREARR